MKKLMLTIAKLGPLALSLVGIITINSTGMAGSEPMPESVKALR
jgi:hypothetical protein